MKIGWKNQIPRKMIAVHALGLSACACLILLSFACKPSASPEAGRVGAGDLATNAPRDLDLASPRHGGRLVVALATEPKTWNPVLVKDLSSRAVVHRLHADLIHIDRETQLPEPHLAERWLPSEDGLRYTLELRPGLRFSDGRPFDSDDVLFSFEVYLDEEVASVERDQLLFEGQAPTVRKIDQLRVEFELPGPYAAAETLFDGLSILPRHRLEEAYRSGRLAEVWGPTAAAEDIVGLGPFRLAAYHPGERVVLERNPYFWQRDDAGRSLPYLDELIFRITPTKEAQTLRFLAGELDVLDRISGDDFAMLGRQVDTADFRLHDLGPGLDYNFMFFNLDDLDQPAQPERARKQAWFRDLGFRRAMLSAIDLDAIRQLIYRGRATALPSFVTPGNKLWVDQTLASPIHGPETARRLLADSGFRWDSEQRLVDRDGVAVEFTLLAIASSSERLRMATLIQNDLRELGIEVGILSLELGAVIERLTKTRNFEACILGLGGGNTSPNRLLSVLRSDGSSHFWRLGREQPTSAWQAEIDRLMQLQLVTLDYATRKDLYDRVQQIVAERLPMLSLVSPNVLVGANIGLANFRPTVLSHHTLWNVQELYWQPKGI